MIPLVVFMTNAQQWALGLLIPTAITLGGNWGMSQFNEGATDRRLNSIESVIASSDLPQMKTDIALNKQKNIDQDLRIESFNGLVKEQIQISNKILGELQKINITTSGQELKINGLSSDFEEFKDDFKEFKKSIDK